MSPEIPSLASLRTFALGALWAAIGGLGPAALLVLDSLARWKDYADPVDWPQVWHLAIGGAAFAVVAYWRKHQALLALPPGTQQETKVTGAGA